jgi:hypothetical protein
MIFLRLKLRPRPEGATGGDSATAGPFSTLKAKQTSELSLCCSHSNKLKIVGGRTAK